VYSDRPLLTWEAARAMHCSQKAIPQLVEKGHLVGTWKGSALWVDRRSIDRFQKKYMRIASIAQAIGSNAQSLLKTCRENNLPMIICRLSGKDGTQVFIPRKYEARLRKLLIRS